MKKTPKICRAKGIDADCSHTLERIGKKLAELRKQKGYGSREDFANAFDLPRVHYWRIEKGKTNLTIKSLHKVLRLHGITIEDFFAMIRP